MSSKGPVVVTGAAGFVGSAVAHAALREGYPVRLLVRASSPRRNLQGIDAEVVEGDMRDPAALGRAMTGAYGLLHVAADYRLWARDPGEIVRNNLDGTRAVMAAALAAGVERVVVTSSVATLRGAARADEAGAGVTGDTHGAHGTHGTDGTEDAPLDPRDAIGAYKRSKVEAERLVERMVARDGLPAVIVNPSTPVGARDVRPTPTGRIVVEAARGRMPAFVDTGLNVADVEDVARGHLLALAHGRPGQRYILGGDDIALRDLLAEIAAMVGRRAPRLRLPIAPLVPLAHVAQAWARRRGGEPFLTVDGLAMARRGMFYSSARARDELGYRPGPHADGLRAALDWFGRERYLDQA